MEEALMAADGTVADGLDDSRNPADRVHIEAEMLRRNEELAALCRIALALSRLAAPEEIPERVYEAMVGRILDNGNLYIALYDEAAGRVEFPVYSIDGERRPPSGRPLGNGI